MFLFRVSFFNVNPFSRPQWDLRFDFQYIFLKYHPLFAILYTCFLSFSFSLLMLIHALSHCIVHALHHHQHKGNSDLFFNEIIFVCLLLPDNFLQKFRLISRKTVFIYTAFRGMSLVVQKAFRYFPRVPGRFSSHFGGK